MPPSGMRHARPHPRAAQQFAAGADVGAVADHAVADQRARADAGAEADDRAFDHRAGLDPHAVEDHRAVEPGARADLGAAADDRAADQQRAGRHRRAVVHQRSRRADRCSAGDGAMPRTRSAEPRTKSSGVPMSRQ